MKTDSIRTYNPEFTAICNIRGNVDAINIDELRTIIMECKTIGNLRDIIDIYIPQNTKHTGGVIPMAGYVKGELKAFTSRFNENNIFEAIMGGLRFAKTNLYSRHVNTGKPHKTNEFLSKLKHVSSKDFDTEIS